MEYDEGKYVHEQVTKDQKGSAATLSLTSALDGCGWSTPSLGHFTPGNRPGTRCTGGWVGPRVGVDGYGKSVPHRASISGPSSL